MMKQPLTNGTTWSTASFAETASASHELLTLCAHLDLCRVTNRRVFAVRCAAERVNGFVAARFVSTLVVLAGLIGVTALLI
jgi:hypothetical protein